MKIPWKRKELSKIGIHELLHKERLLALHPKPELLNKTSVSYKLNTPVGVQLNNIIQVSCDQSLIGDVAPVVYPAADCPCQKYKTAGAHLDDGHVVTADPSVIKDLFLKSLWLKGRKYRWNTHPEDIYSAIEDGVTEYVKRAAKRSLMDISEFQGMERSFHGRSKGKVLKRVADGIPQRNSTDKRSRKTRVERFANPYDSYLC